MGILRRAILIAVILVMATTLTPAQTETPTNFLGLEMKLIPVASTGTTIGLALRDYDEVETGMDQRTRSRLHANGLRIIAVPIAELENAMNSLVPVSTIQTESIGMLYRWSPLVTGPELPEDYTRLDSGPLRLSQGRFRLLARAWIVPDISSASDHDVVEARLRLELLPQHIQVNRRRFEHLIDPLPTTIEDAGLLFKRLKASLDIPADHAIVIVPAAPSADWSSLRESNTPDQHASPGDNTPSIGPEVDPASPESVLVGRPERPVDRPPPSQPDSQRGQQPSSRVVGPVAPSLQSIGEKLLRRQAGVSGRTGPNGQAIIERERSLVVVLIPHTPERYALIP